ncbi:MAG: hypothetical protein KDD83_00540, partial [Caldilineaceae bacterium]|nr:hypothetical protein [Caldilineaceae bacterium]
MTDSRTCHACGHNNRPQARFCAKCGVSLDASQETSSPAANPWPDVDGVRWRRRPGEIAARISPNRLGGDLIVDQGMRAVILRDGAMLEDHGPGRYPLRTGFWARFWSGQQDEDITILLIDSGEISLDFALSDLWTMDPLRLHANCRIAVQVDDPVRFYHNVVKDSPTYTERDLRARIYP